MIVITCTHKVWQFVTSISSKVQLGMVASKWQSPGNTATYVLCHIKIIIVTMIQYLLLTADS